MKTKNNVQKAILRTFAVVISFVLVSYTVSAQDFWKKLLENSSFNTIAQAMVKTSNDSSDQGTSASASRSMSYYQGFLEESAEPALEMEEWMENINQTDAASFELYEQAESEIQLEEWMLDENYFNVHTAQESALVLEEWMFDDEVWKI